jgi:hypothetical protein
MKGGKREGLSDFLEDLGGEETQVLAVAHRHLLDGLVALAQDHDVLVRHVRVGDIDVRQLARGGRVFEGILGAGGWLDGVEAREARHVQANEVVCAAQEEVDAVVRDVLAVADVKFGHVGEHIHEVLQGLVGDGLAVGEGNVAELLAVLQELLELVVLHAAVGEIHCHEII